MEECLEHFTTAEILNVEEQWYCVRCKQLRPATKKITLVAEYMPKILIIHLKRFNARGEKLSSLVQFPIENFNLAPFVRRSGMSISDNFETHPLMYDLYAYTKHIGSTMPEMQIVIHSTDLLQTMALFAHHLSMASLLSLSLNNCLHGCILHVLMLDQVN